ncbi:hypothetical protein HYW55_01160 [Candidatus Gottesmanbacteria bacterium]|nr:hypothetical protein [Candidatus Gottesmanbacteria bacterium]
MNNDANFYHFDVRFQFNADSVQVTNDLRELPFVDNVLPMSKNKGQAHFLRVLTRVMTVDEMRDLRKRMQKVPGISKISTAKVEIE